MILRTTNSNMLGFSAVTRLSADRQPWLTMGGLLLAGDTVGMIANIEISADPMVEQLAAMSRPLPAAVVEDNRANRVGFATFQCLIIGTWLPDVTVVDETDLHVGRLLKKLPEIPPLTLTTAVPMGDRLFPELPMSFHYVELLTNKSYYSVPLPSIMAAHYEYLKAWIDPDETVMSKDDPKLPSNEFAASVIAANRHNFDLISLFQRLIWDQVRM